MEINQYDQYIPNKELDTNFRISRKRTADESLGNYNYQQQSMLNYPNPTKIPAYGYDYKNVSSIPTPMDSGNTSFTPGQVTNTNQTGMVEYPMRQMSSNFNKGTEVERDGPLWLGDSNNKSFYNQNNTGSYGATNQNDSMWTRRYDSKGFQVQPDASTDRSNSAGMINNQQGNWDNMSGGYKKNYYNSGSGAAFQNQREFGNANTWKNNFGGSQNKNDKTWTGYGNKSNEGRNNFNRYWKKPEKPKTSNRPLDIPDKVDESLPADLRDMFQPLFCKLCSMQFSSNVMAKMHYVSKNHEKKIRKYLIEYAEKTGEPLHPRATVTAAEKKEKAEDKDPRNFYCEICDLQLTGKKHADAHYMGKSHNAVRMGKKKPGGKGYFDQNGKWIRVVKEKKPMLHEDGDNFGMDFKKKPEEVDTINTETFNADPPKGKMQFTCSLCTVSCVSQEQLDIHLGGAKHRKKLKLKGITPENFILSEDPNEKEAEIVEKNVSEYTTDDSLKSRYITPNGLYYCEKCNLTVNSEKQFKQHLDSKNHAKKANEKKV